MSATGDSAILAQLLRQSETTSLAVTELVTRTAVVEQLVRELHSDSADHESRLRNLEQSRSRLLTRAEYATDQAEVNALRDARAASRTRWLIAIGTAAVMLATPAWTLALNWLLTGQT